MPIATPSFDRRAHARLPVHGDVVVHAGGRTIHARIAAISETDLDVHCQLGFALLGMAGQTILVEVQLDSPESASWMLRGRVRFVRPATHCLVVEYAADPDTASAIAALLLRLGDAAVERQLLAFAGEHEDRLHERERAPTAVDDDELRRERQT